MMLKLAKLGIAIAALATLIVPAAYAGVPDVTQSFFVPQSGSVTTPCEGAVSGANGCAATPAGGAIRNFRRCPNDDGTQVLTNSARLKVVVKASDGSPIMGIPAADICLLFNGGTAAQGFAGAGDDSVIATNQYNPLLGCPDVRCVPADAATDASGVTYITLLGATAGSPGVATRDPLRKWGGYAGDIPVMVLGFKLQGKLTSGSALGSYTAHVKSLDFVGGRTATPLNAGELVNSLDINPVQSSINTATYNYARDFDNNGVVNSLDYNFIRGHNGHTCNVPNVN